jgi:hypothetical protein
MPSSTPIYGRAAVLAAEIVASRGFSPRDAWDFAIAKLTDSPSSQNEGCPRSAYLGLREAGLVVGIGPGEYASRQNSVNARYARDAHQLLRSDPALGLDKKKLWNLVPAPKAGSDQGEMDVVIALWNRRFLR